MPQVHAIVLGGGRLHIFRSLKSDGSEKYNARAVFAAKEIRHGEFFSAVHESLPRKLACLDCRLRPRCKHASGKARFGSRAAGEYCEQNAKERVDQHILVVEGV